MKLFGYHLFKKTKSFWLFKGQKNNLPLCLIKRYKGRLLLWGSLGFILVWQCSRSYKS